MAKVQTFTDAMDSQQSPATIDAFGRLTDFETDESFQGGSWSEDGDLSAFKDRDITRGVAYWMEYSDGHLAVLWA